LIPEFRHKLVDLSREDSERSDVLPRHGLILGVDSRPENPRRDLVVQALILIAKRVPERGEFFRGPEGKAGWT
jgi:hypothetical protein